MTSPRGPWGTWGCCQRTSTPPPDHLGLAGLSWRALQGEHALQDQDCFVRPAHGALGDIRRCRIWFDIFSVMIVFHFSEPPAARGTKNKWPRHCHRRHPSGRAPPASFVLVQGPGAQPSLKKAPKGSLSGRTNGCRCRPPSEGLWHCVFSSTVVNLLNLA